MKEGPRRRRSHPAVTGNHAEPVQYMLTECYAMFKSINKNKPTAKPKGRDLQKRVRMRGKKKILPDWESNPGLPRLFPSGSDKRKS